MAIVILGKSECPLCGNVIQASEDYMATSHFLPAGPLSKYSDAAMHRECFKAWPKAEKFRLSFNDVGRSWPGGPLQMLEDGTVLVVDVEDLPPVADRKPRLNLTIFGSPDDQGELLSALDRLNNVSTMKEAFPEMKEYVAIVFGDDVPASRVSVMAANLREAKTLLEQKYGTNIFNLHNEHDANQPR